MVMRALLPLLFATVLGQASSDDLGGIVIPNKDVTVSANKPPPTEATGSITEAERIRRENLQQQFGDGKLTVRIDSIFPKAGPTQGETRVLVRGGPFQDMNLLYPQPKCKFGSRDMIVGATYVTCTTKPLEVYEYEGGHQNRDSYCLQCESSPPSKEAGMVSVMVSLTGDFTDTIDSEPFQYYLAPKVTAIYPRYGSKDGDTEVQVWGENFLNFAQHTRCGFGSKTTVAHFISSTYMICKSPTSEVVGKAIPFTISLNQQQNTKENIDFWYYNRPAVSLLLPNYGPDKGGNTITLKGANFQPFDWQRDIDNRNDTFCWFEQEGVYMPLTAISPTKATCEVPPDLLHLGSTFVEVTLNNNRYPVSQPTGDKSDDNVPYFYFKPSKITNIEPKEGPTTGGTIVMVYGADFMAGKKIICNFDGIQTRGVYVALGQIKCKSPPHTAGPINLSIAYDGEDSKFASEQATFLYYETPVVTSIEPLCGPVTGYTQIKVTGKNFVEMGFGKVHCLFNGTSMNATVLDQQTLVCDSPRLTEDQAGLDTSYLFSNVQVTLNGRDTSAELIKFNYYPELQIQQVGRNVGPVSGKTTTTLTGLNFIHPHVCNPAVKYGAMTVKPVVQGDQFIITSPKVNVPGAVTLFPSGNGQNYPTDYILRYRNYENTFTYIQDVFVQDLAPSTGPSSGGTKIVVRGYGFLPLKHGNGTVNEVKPIARFVDSSGNVIGQASEIVSPTNTQFTWYSPAGPAGSKVTLQISYNGEYFQNLFPNGQQSSFTYYNAPVVNSITPKYGPVKFSQNATINGYGFQCPDATCANLLIRFGSEKEGTIVPGVLQSSSSILVLIPAYTKPDVLPIELSFNGIDFTHSNLTYGYFDPFVIKTTPVLVSSTHPTTLKLHGFGYINPEDQSNIKVKFTSPQGELTCAGVSPCIVQGLFIDKETIQCTSFQMSQISYADGTPVKIGDPLYTEVTLLNSIFTDNKVPIYYYQELAFKTATDGSITNNIEQPILVETDFQWDVNHQDQFEKYANFTCAFQVGDERVEVPGRLETMPFGAQYDSNTAQPTHIACSTPHLHNSGKGTLTITPNGQTYSGNDKNHINLDIQPNLELARILPQCGPIEGMTRVKLMGLGLNNPKDTVYNKFGVHAVSELQRASVQTLAWSQQDWLDPQLMTNGDLSQFKHIDYPLKQGDSLQQIYVSAPKSPSSKLGGAVYVDIGQNIQLTQVSGDGSNHTAVIQSYANSMVEYYYYKSPQVVKVEPNAGLAIGGTPIEISGAWFDLKLEYGLVPHCKIGEKIVRATLSSTVRIVCHSPPNTNLDQPLPVKVSLNGIDWVDTKFTFSYYIQPSIYDVYPKYGQMNGGTEVFILGENFSNITDPEITKCRWTLIDNANGSKRDRIIQFTPAYYLNSTQMMCITPSSFIGGDRALIQITFNSKDYSQEDNLIFQFYSILGSFPKSGPSNARNEVILVKGAGFKPTSTIYCFLNKTEKMLALEVTENLIKCPMIWPSKDLSATGAVRFGISMEGSWTDFGDFFYYTQIELDDVFPRYGPAEGHGIVYLTGTKFRDDFHNSELGCKIGENIGKGEIMNTTCIRCVVEQMDLVNEGETLPVMVALNSYSWVGERSNGRMLSSDTKGYIPYGVQTIFPESGVLEGFTDIFVTGKGFTADIAERAKCRFGVDSNYHIVDAEVLDYTKLVCRTPAADFNSFQGSELISVPFSISFGEQENKPWTQDLHRFRFYKQPILAYAVPDEISVRKKTEIYVFAEDDSRFYQPVPTSSGLQDHHGTSGVSCSFGEFGTSMGMYVNQTTMLCLTPHISGSTDDYSSTTVTVGIAMNGQDFLEDTSNAQVTFVGTGSSHLFLNFIVSALLIALLCLAVFTFIVALLNWMNPPQDIQSNVILLRGGQDGSQTSLRQYNNSLRPRTPAIGNV